MTLGEKIKKARTENNLTQVELANKLMVSRQAITKWEADKGVPDIANIKALSQLLCVSIDYLLDDGNTIDETVIREKINLAKYGKALIKKTLTDKLIRDKFPDAEIHTLVATKKRDKVDKAVDTFVLLATPFPDITDIINSLKLLGTEYYLVNDENKQFFIAVNYKDGFMESRRTNEFKNSRKGDKFPVDDLIFTDSGKLKNK